MSLLNVLHTSYIVLMVNIDILYVLPCTCPYHTIYNKIMLYKNEKLDDHAHTALKYARTMA
jgi:hypothetical protein